MNWLHTVHNSSREIARYIFTIIIKKKIKSSLTRLIFIFIMYYDLAKKNTLFFFIFFYLFIF